MTTNTPLPSIEALKAQARNLRGSLENEGNFIKHGEALEFIAAQYGYRDWNTLHAAAGHALRGALSVGSKVSGAYLGQPFTGTILSLTALGGGTHFRVSLDLDQAVDVVRFDSFSALRKRISGTVDRQGLSHARTSDGTPHLVIEVAGEDTPRPSRLPRNNSGGAPQDEEKRAPHAEVPRRGLEARGDFTY